MRKLIVLEVNEVPHKVFEYFIKNHPDSILSKVIAKSKKYVTNTTDKGELHPWSTWPTLYRGVDNSIHQIKDIGENLEERNMEFPPVWNILENNKISLGIFASLHTYPLTKNYKKYDFLVPDPFALGSEAHPKRIIPFQAFNLAMTQKSGRNVDSGIDKKSAAKLLLALPGLGLRIKTISKTLNQLVSEKIQPWKTSRRRSFQSILAFDLYIKLLKKHKPSFTTFFTNHVASAMHRYWAATFPEDYSKNDLPQEWIDRYKNEIPFCMKELDQMVSSLDSFLNKNKEYKLIIASSMGQEATKAELVNHEVFLSYPAQFASFFRGFELKQLGSMHPQYNFSSEAEPEKFENLLKSIKINGEPITYRRKEINFFSFDLGYPNIENCILSVGSKNHSLEELGLEIKPIDDQSAGTAYHIPEGAMYIYDPNKHENDIEKKSIDLREVAPAILDYFNVEKPDHMKHSNTFKL